MIPLSGELAAARAEIERHDRALAVALLARLDCARRIARIKRAQGLPAFDVEREAEVIERVAREAPSAEAVMLFRAIWGALFEAQRPILEAEIEGWGKVG